MTTRLDPIALWPTDAPELAGTDPADRPLLTPFTLDQATNAPAIIVCPGGGYQMRAEHEGAPIAEWLNTLGIAAFVLDYRVSPYRHPAPLNDAQRAIRTVRARATEHGVDPHRIGILGFSAGGHLAATAATQWDQGDTDDPDPIRQASSRPDLAVLCYAVISTIHALHMGSMRNLLGETPTLEERRALSGELNVTPETPPSYIWHTADDPVVDVDNAYLFASALRRHGIPHALHVFPTGPHGLGLAADHPEANIWPELCASFLRQQEWID